MQSLHKEKGFGSDSYEDNEQVLVALFFFLIQRLAFGRYKMLLQRSLERYATMSLIDKILLGKGSHFPRDHMSFFGVKYSTVNDDKK